MAGTAKAFLGSPDFLRVSVYHTRLLAGMYWTGKRFPASSTMQVQSANKPITIQAGKPAQVLRYRDHVSSVAQSLDILLLICGLPKFFTFLNGINAVLKAAYPVPMDRVVKAKGFYGTTVASFPFVAPLEGFRVVGLYG